MPPTEVLTSASLTPSERRVVERLVERLREELGSDLHAIWLYGKGDYEAVTPEPGEAEAIVDGAEDFLAAVEDMLAG